MGVRASHPMWVRGLKLHDLLAINMANMSHPMWVRGLKQPQGVATGAQAQVAPHVGAWIETFTKEERFKCFLSHPMWVRGLKQASINEKMAHA